MEEEGEEVEMEKKKDNCAPRVPTKMMKIMIWKAHFFSKIATLRHSIMQTTYVHR